MKQTATGQITKFMWPTWGPPGSCRPQLGRMLAPWTSLSGSIMKYVVAHYSWDVACSVDGDVISHHIISCLLWRYETNIPGGILESSSLCIHDWLLEHWKYSSPSLRYQLYRTRWLQIHELRSFIKTLPAWHRDMHADDYRRHYRINHLWVHGTLSRSAIDTSEPVW